MKKITINSLILVIFVFYLFTIIVFGDRVEYYRYSNITFLVLIGFMTVYIARRPLTISARIFMFSPFLCFSFLSMIWSYIPENTLQRSITLLRLFVLMFIMTLYLYQSKRTELFIYGIAVAGILILLYIFSFYGFSGLRKMIDDGMRVGGEFVNSNTLAIYLSFSFVIFFYLFLNKKRWYYLLFALGLAVIIATTGSKKGILDLAVGFIMVIGLNQDSSSRKKRLFKWIIGIFIGVVILYFLWNSSLFAMVKTRYEDMFRFLLGTGTRIDYSTRERQIMLIAGWQQFLKTPLLGIGLGSSGYITNIVLGSDTYLHNEYIELLATGGIVGLLLQFIPIIIIFIQNWKYRKISKASLLCTVLMGIYLINGIAAVQYYSKLTYVILSISLACYLDNRKKVIRGSLDCRA